jgi:hypothetical protein
MTTRELVGWIRGLVPMLEVGHEDGVDACCHST